MIAGQYDCGRAARASSYREVYVWERRPLARFGQVFDPFNEELINYVYSAFTTGSFLELHRHNTSDDTRHTNHALFT